MVTYINSLLSTIIHTHRFWSDTYLIVHDAVPVQKVRLPVPGHAFQNRWHSTTGTIHINPWKELHSIT